MKRFAVRQQACFGELVKRIDRHLDHEEQQENSRDLEEPLHIDQVTKPGPTHRKRDRCTETKQCAIDQVWILYLHQHQSRFHSLARDHQKGKKKHTQHCREARTLRRNCAQSFAHALLNLWSTAPHVNHERADHHHRNRAENRFAQGFIRKELC